MATAFLDRVSNKAIGQLLLEKGIITAEQLDEALEAGKRDNLRIGQALMRLGYVSREALGYVLGEQFGVRPMELHPSMLDERLIRRFPLDLLQEHQMLPLIEVGDELVVVVSDPNDTDGLKELSSLVPNYTISPQLADAGQVSRCLETLAGKRMRSSGLTTPLFMPTECRIEPVVPQPTEVSYANWLVTTCLQQPDDEVVVRQIGDSCQIARRKTSRGGALEELHRFSSDQLIAVRDALWRNCVTLDHTNEQAAMWSSPLRFAGKTYDLLVLNVGTGRAPMLRLRPLLRVVDREASSADYDFTVPDSGTIKFVTYSDVATLTGFVESLLLRESGNHISLLFQDVTRRSFEGVQLLPGGISDAVQAAATIGATCVIFDSPPPPRTIYGLLRSSATAPAVIICTPLAATEEGENFSPDIDELRRRIPSQVHRLETTITAASSTTGDTNGLS